MKTIPVELWLDGGLLQAAGTPASAQSTKTTIEYTDRGVPVEVQAPPADQVGELKLPH